MVFIEATELGILAENLLASLPYVPSWATNPLSVPTLLHGFAVTAAKK